MALSIEDIVNKLRLISKSNSLLNESIIENPSDTVIQYNKEGKLLHIWLHGNINHTSYRLAYEMVKGEYVIQTYVWVNGEGWKVVEKPSIDENIMSYQPKKLW